MKKKAPKYRGWRNVEGPIPFQRVPNPSPHQECGGGRRILRKPLPK